MLTPDNEPESSQRARRRDWIFVTNKHLAGVGTLRSHFLRRAMTSPAAPVALFGSTGGVGPSGRPAPKTGGSGAHGLSAETALAVRPRPVASFVQISPLRTAQPPRRLTRHPPTDHSPRRLWRTTLPRARISAATPRRAWTRRHSLPSARWRRRSRPTRGCTPSPAAPSDDDDDDRPMTT